MRWREGEKGNVNLMDVVTILREITVKHQTAQELKDYLSGAIQAHSLEPISFTSMLSQEEIERMVNLQNVFGETRAIIAEILKDFISKTDRHDLTELLEKEDLEGLSKALEKELELNKTFDTTSFPIYKKEWDRVEKTFKRFRLNNRKLENLLKVIEKKLEVSPIPKAKVILSQIKAKAEQLHR